ncbi:hypothetical protein CSA37_07610 [Candidatus Fermentibacteria bacterium]|nr:MAG: hypothetical protein CSA37_07610 [Candidatus Fermentibacteria bacterium]
MPTGLLWPLIPCRLLSMRMRQGTDSRGGKAETDFLTQLGNVIPVEVKAAENLQGKSLLFCKNPFSTPLSICSFKLRREPWLVNLHLYAVSSLFEMIKFSIQS